MDGERVAYLALTQVPGMGAARLQTLLTACKTAIGAHSAPIAFLRALPGFSGPISSALKATPLDVGLKTLEAAAKLFNVSPLLVKHQYDNQLAKTADWIDW